MQKRRDDSGFTTGLVVGLFLGGLGYWVGKQWREDFQPPAPPSPPRPAHTLESPR